MATVTWTGSAGDNDFNNPGNWSTNTVPGGGDDVVVPAGGFTIVHNAGTTDTISTLTLSGGDTIDVTGGAIDVTGGGTNNGIFEATGSGTVILAGGTMVGSGTIEASGGTSLVKLQNSVVISGETLTTTGTGLIETATGNTATLNGITLTSGSQFDTSGTSMVTFLEGVITNNGTMTLNNNNARYLVDFQIVGATTLAGNGLIQLGGSNGPSNNNRIIAQNSADVRDDCRRRPTRCRRNGAGQ
jgi:hypothetical protein